VGFGPDDAHAIIWETDIRQLDLDTNAYGSMRLTSPIAAARSLSPDGRYLAYLDDSGSDTAALHVFDLSTSKETAKWVSQFHSVSGLALGPDAKNVATASYSSLRLWDVAEKKQLWKREGERSGGAQEPFFSDDGKELVVGGQSAPIAWDLATGKETTLVPPVTPKNVLRVVKAPEGVALILEDEVRLLPTNGDPRTVCKGIYQPYGFPIIGPTSIAFSPSGKSFACAMSDGWVHVLDTSTWAEKAVIKKGAASPIERPVDLYFSADDATLTDVSNVGFIVYDAATGKESKKVAFAHPGATFAARHARFDDGTVGVRTWNGKLAIFGADGAWQRDVGLVASAPIEAHDAFASSGKTYATVVGKTLHVVDLATGDDKTTELPTFKPRDLAVSPDGKTVLVAGSDGVITAVTDGAPAPYAHAKGIRVGFAGSSALVWQEKATIDAYTSPTSAPMTIELDANGVVVRDPSGAFDTRGKPEAVCVVGSTYLSRVTCDDRGNAGLVRKWIVATFPPHDG
jgi:WD40 repeat protein